MKRRCVLFIALSAILSLAQAPSSAQKPLSKTQLKQLVAAGMDNEQLAKTLGERGIDFELSGEDLVGLRQKGAQPVLLKARGGMALRMRKNPFDKDLLHELVAAGTDSGTLAKAVLERGIDFQPTSDYPGAAIGRGQRCASEGAARGYAEAADERSGAWIVDRWSR
jgi:hypothetical protein